jgi:hypothetical protein
VIGMRHWDMTPDTVGPVVNRYPRQELTRNGYQLVQAESKPRTRTQLLNRWLRFGTLVRHSQFAE